MSPHLCTQPGNFSHERTQLVFESSGDDNLRSVDIDGEIRLGQGRIFNSVLVPSPDVLHEWNGHFGEEGKNASRNFSDAVHQSSLSTVL